MCEEYSNVLTTPAEADKIDCLADTDMSVKSKKQPDISARPINRSMSNKIKSVNFVAQ